MSDAWPPRNLGRGDYWGRTVERRVDGWLSKNGMTGQRVSGYDRYSSSSGQTLSETAQGISDLAASIESAILVTPRYFTRNTSRSDFAIGDSWGAVSRETFTAPAGFSTAEISASATISSFQQGTAGDDFKWPFPLSDVTSEFGPRPPLPFHRGIDFGEASGTPIPAAHNGTVILRGYYDDWGNYTRVSCSDLTGVSGSWTGYAHMNAYPLIPAGQPVTQGQTLGYVGTTGLSTGPHLHWETALEGVRINPRDFMGIFGGSSTSFTEIQARIVINGVASPAFHPYLDMGLSALQLNFPVFGRSLSGAQEVTVELQMRSRGGRVARDPKTVAALSIRGGFSQ